MSSAYYNPIEAVKAQFHVGDRIPEEEIPPLVRKALELDELLTLFNVDHFHRKDVILKAWRKGKEISACLPVHPLSPKDTDYNAKETEIMKKFEDLEKLLSDLRLQVAREEETVKLAELLDEADFAARQNEKDASNGKQASKPL